MTLTPWQFCTSGAAIYQAGLHANAGLVATAAALLGFYEHAVGKICVSTHTDWAANYAGLDDSIKAELASVSSSLIAMDIISYDPTGYLTREADMIMNKNNSIIAAGMAALKDKVKHTLSAP